MTGHRADIKQTIAGASVNLQKPVAVHATSHNHHFDSCYTIIVTTASSLDGMYGEEGRCTAERDGKRRESDKTLSRQAVTNNIEENKDANLFQMVFQDGSFRLRQIWQVICNTRWRSNLVRVQVYQPHIIWKPDNTTTTIATVHTQVLFPKISAAITLNHQPYSQKQRGVLTVKLTWTTPAWSGTATVTLSSDHNCCTITSGSDVSCRPRTLLTPVITDSLIPRIVDAACTSRHGGPSHFVLTTSLLCQFSPHIRKHPSISLFPTPEAYISAYGSLALFSSRISVSTFRQMSTPSSSRGRCRGKSTSEKRVWSGKANTSGGWRVVYSLHLEDMQHSRHDPPPPLRVQQAAQISGKAEHHRRGRKQKR
ncbi:hypothetical protein PR048_027757 [Dryococelus australis]|uniref:Uncharacterized protein n=1 Tax=Dryococelus australis TaxID=614101 RepID=A0ABQ9GHD2_9NEOP|nr:hypothetical protein PR048_027757 [Dryococelus australis]